MKPGTGDPVWCPESPASCVAIIAALELEAAILRRMPGAVAAPVYVSGPGQAAAARAARRALDDGADSLVAWGLAGGLSAPAETGAVMLPERLVGDGGVWLSDPAWRERLVAAIGPRFPVFGGVLCTADRVVTTPEAKASLARQTGAAAVDMESAAVAGIAAAAGKRFVAVRVIADGPDDALPRGAERLVTASGRTRFAGLPGVLLSRGGCGSLLRLAARSHRARAVLRELAETLAERTR